jgi:hypothetical protein
MSDPASVSGDKVDPFVKSAAALAAASGNKYGVTTDYLGSKQDLRGFVDRAAKIETIAGGLAGKDRAEVVASLATLDEKELDRKFKASGRKVAELDEKRGTLLDIGREAADRLESDDDKRKLRKQAVQSVERGSAMGSLANAFAKVGLDIQVVNSAAEARAVSLGGQPGERKDASQSPQVHELASEVEAIKHRLSAIEQCLNNASGGAYFGGGSRQ